MPAEETQSGGRFVLLRHEGSAEYKPGVHWDLMFERGESLRTWALVELPAASRAVDAERLPDHRLAYLDYEGPVSGNRGSVSRHDTGQFALISESADEWIAEVTGQHLCGRLILRHEATGIAARAAEWRCTFEPVSA